MPITRVIGNIVLLVYAWITLCAFGLTVLRLPLYYPKSVVKFAYGMMAPYQSYDRAHVELRVEGRLPDGSWERIDLDPYYPVLRGEKMVRHFTVSVRYAEHYREPYARRLLAMLQEYGYPYEAVRLTWRNWPNEPGDYHQGDMETVTKEYDLGTYE